MSDRSMFLKYSTMTPEEIHELNEQSAAGVIASAVAVAERIPRTIAIEDEQNRRAALRATRALVNRALKPDLKSRLSTEELETLKRAKSELVGKR